MVFAKIREDFGRATSDYEFRKDRGYFVLVIKPIVEGGISLNSFKVRVKEESKGFTTVGEMVGMGFLIAAVCCCGTFCTI